MATEKLLKAVITGPADKLDEAIQTLVMERQFHPTNAASSLKFLGNLKTPDEPNPYRSDLDLAVSLLSKLNIEPAYREFDVQGFELESVSVYLRSLSGTCSRLITQKNAADSLVDDNNLLVDRLIPFSELGVDIGGLLSVKRMELRFGNVQPEAFDAIAEYAEKDRDIFLFRTGEDEEEIHCVYLALPDASDKIAENFEALGFRFIDKPDETGLNGIPAERLTELRAEIDDAKKRTAEIKAELAATAMKERDTILSRYSWLLYMSSAFDLRANAVLKFGRFHITGWIPRKDGKAFSEEAAALGMECLLEKPRLTDENSIPAKMRGGLLSRVFTPFMEMYGYPAYGEVDPRLFVAISYILMFGIMFGDAGQGAVLVLFGLWLAKKKGSWLGRILACVGCSSIVFGFIYGSVFGNEHLLPGLIKVLEGDSMMTVLLSTVGLGIVLIIISMVQNIITGIRQHNPRKAYFSANGVAGGVLFIAVVAGLAAQMLLSIHVFSKVYIILFIALPGVCLFCAEPLSKLVKREKHWLPESWGMFFLEGFFDLFEMCLSYFSNVVSFLRVGAYAICHAGMMMVVYLLAGDGSVIWGVVVGNALVMVIEAVLVFIQVLRLEFYELFGRFYSGLGSPFTPVRVDYAAAGTHS